jgi:hypothetical protein
MGKIMCINIIKGVGALLPVIIILFIINVAFSMAIGTPHTPNLEIAFAWFGTVGAMFYMATGFWRRVAAALLGSIASIAARFAFGFLTAAALSTGVLTEGDALLFMVGPFAVIANIGQLVIGHVVARAIVRRAIKTPSKLAAA